MAISNTPKVRVRFAPSPTGYLHVGGARTALFNYLYAKRTGGEFLLRVEDTDLERSTEESMKMQIQDLQWLHLPWDEGVDPQTFKDKGPLGPYRQSQRKHIYQEHADRLLLNGQAYYDFRTDEELEVLKQQAIKDGRPHQVETPTQIIPVEEAQKRIAAGEKAAIRFRVRERKDYFLHDLIRGEVRFPSDMVGDFVCIRSNGMPVYNFCCVVDDALMKITHVFRAEEHLSNTLRQMMLYEAFGYALPLFGHMSIILGADKQKLSKRHGATSCNEYSERGYLPEALCNFIALLGWSSPEGQEILTREQMISQFGYERMNPAPAVFDEQKLQWMNSMYLRALPHDDLWQRLKPFLDRAGVILPDSVASSKEWQSQALGVFKTSMTTLLDGVPLFAYLSDAGFELKPEAGEALAWPETKKVWLKWQELLGAHPSEFLSEADFNKMQEEVKVACEVKGKHLFMPIRVAIIGQPHGAELKMLVPLMPKLSLLKRVGICLAQLKSQGLK
jgi:nondiscriminating glutamyl-tRNA synthetase